MGSGHTSKDFRNIKKSGTDSERILVELLKQNGFTKAEREFSSAPVRYARPDVWAYKPPKMSYAFEVKSSVSDSTVVPSWQIVKVNDFLLGWTDHNHFPMVAAHLGKKKGKRWVFHLLSQVEVDAAKNTVELIKAQEKIWRSQGQHSKGQGGRGLFHDASLFVFQRYKKKDMVTLEGLGYSGSKAYLFYKEITKNDIFGDNIWKLSEDPLETLKRPGINQPNNLNSISNLDATEAL